MPPAEYLRRRIRAAAGKSSSRPTSLCRFRGRARHRSQAGALCNDDEVCVREDKLARPDDVHVAFSKLDGDLNFAR